jgi:hypothetical protein
VRYGDVEVIGINVSKHEDILLQVEIISPHFIGVGFLFLPKQCILNLGLILGSF